MHEALDQIQLELARRADAAQIARMSREEVEVGLGWSWTPARVVRAIGDRETVVLVARHRHRLAGFAIMQFYESRAHLNLLAVGSPYRRGGLGRRMIEWLEQSALVAGIGEIHLEVRAANHAARRFYRALHYRDAAVVRGYYGGVESAVRMVRRLWVRPADESGPAGSPFRA